MPVRVGWLVSVLLLAAGLPLAGAADGPARLVDEEGDAREKGVGEHAHVACASGLTCGLNSLGWFTSGPAHPSTDIVGVAFEETANALVVHLEVASLEEDLAPALGPNDGEAPRGVTWAVCWTTSTDRELEEGEGVAECAQFLAHETVRGLATQSRLHKFGPCNAFAWCGWTVASSLTYGSPGRVTWTVPRALLEHGEAGASVRAPQATTWRWFGAATPPVLTSFSVGSNTYDYDWGGSDSGYALDLATLPYDEGDEDAWRASFLAFELPSTAAVPPWGEYVDQEDQSGFREMTDIEILRTVVREDARGLTLATEVARVDDAPEDHYYNFYVGRPDGEVLRGGYEARGAERRPWAGYCGGGDCDDWVSFDFTLEVVPGSPGWVNVTLPPEVVGGAPGDLLTIAYTNLNRVDYHHRSDGRESFGTFAGWDWSSLLPPYRLGSNVARDVADVVAAPVVRRGVTVEDAFGDVRLPSYGLPPGLPALASVSSTSTFDLARVHAEGLTALESRFQILVDDLASIEGEIPPTFKAVVYAAAVETSSGSFLVGYYRERALPGQATGAEFYFCSEDTAVFAPEKKSPLLGRFDEIRGHVSLAQDPSSAGQQGAPSSENSTANATRGSSSLSTIWLFVPHTCFAVFEPGAVPVHRLAAGVYLVDTQDQLVAVDEPDGEASGVLEAQSARTAPRAWYAAPFGVENFWDITGILLAVAVSGVGVAAVARKRGRLRRYLQEIDRAVAEPSAPSREGALAAIRSRAKSDVVRGRLSDGHYVIVERRLDEHLSKARVEALAEAFDELPHRLLVRLQTLLVDGRLSREDYLVFSTLLEDAPLTPEVRERVRRKLQVWLTTDV